MARRCACDSYPFAPPNKHYLRDHEQTTSIPPGFMARKLEGVNDIVGGFSKFTNNGRLNRRLRRQQA